MKIVTASGERQLIMSSKEWKAIGKVAGWTPDTKPGEARDYAPLSDDKVNRIAEILKDAWAVPPSQKASAALRAAGFTADDLWKFGKTDTGRLLPDHWRDNTYNDLRDSERSHARGPAPGKPGKPT